MKLLVVTTYYKPAYIYGGPTRSVSSICEALARLGVYVEVLTTNANGTQRLDVPLQEPVDVNGVTVYYFPLTTSPFVPYYSSQWAQVCRKRVKEFDLLNLEVLFALEAHISASSARSHSVPYVMPLRGQLMPWALRRSRWKKVPYMALFGWRALNAASALHCSSFAEQREVESLGLKAPTYVIPNGLDLERFENMPPRGALRARLGISEEALVLLFMGRLCAQKRPQLAIDALSAAQSLSTEIHLIMAGPDYEALTPRLESHAQQLDCRANLHLTGLLGRDETLQALADADLLLMPSAPNSESFGMSAVEALAAGVPVIVSEGVPVGAWVEKFNAGRVAPSTSEAFTQATYDMLAMPDQLRTMGQNGRQCAQQHFDINKVAWQQLEQYQSILEAGRPLET